MQNLQGKTAVVTGGTSGIGLSTAKALLASGSKVIITGRNEDTTKTIAREIGAIGIISDQSDLSHIDDLVKQTVNNIGKVDILFINAGISAFSPIDTISEEQFDSVFNTNFKGALFTLQKFIPVLNDGASIILLSSINAYNAMSTTAVYAASKAALNSLAKVAAIELAPRGIRVNTVLPGPVNTPLWGKVGIPESQLPEMASLIQSKVPLKKFGTSTEISNTVLFLASDDSSYTTGAEFVVDGGFNLNSLVG